MDVPKKGRMPISRRNSPTRALQTTAIMGFLQGIGNFLRRPGKLNQGIARDIRHLAAFTAADHFLLPSGQRTPFHDRR